MNEKNQGPSWKKVLGISLSIILAIVAVGVVVIYNIGHDLIARSNYQADEEVKVVNELPEEAQEIVSTEEKRGVVLNEEELNDIHQQMNNMNELVTITTKDVEKKLIVLRNQKVLLDCDVAELYGVKTKEVNQAVKNNPEKFPYGYIFVLDKYEKSEVVKNFDRLNKLKFSTVEPTAFTQRGLYMLATIIKSPRATNTTLAIVDTFVTVREAHQRQKQR